MQHAILYVYWSRGLALDTKSFNSNEGTHKLIWELLRKRKYIYCYRIIRIGVLAKSRGLRVFLWAIIDVSIVPKICNQKNISATQKEDVNSLK